MSEEQTVKSRLEIAHVLFIDIVGYSKLLIDEQAEALQELNQIVRKTEAAREAETAGQLILLPTGDGMALVFTGSVEEPVECALEISQALRAQPSPPVRMGIHSGPVHSVADVNERANIAGAGINIAQRVMDCGDAGHILISKRVADDLAHSRRWQPYLHELGDCEVKHGVVVSAVNLYADGVGNPEPPGKFKRDKSEPRPAASSTVGKRSPLLIILVVIGLMLFCLAVLGIIFAPAILKQTRARAKASSVPSAADGDDAHLAAAPIPEKSIAVLPFENLSSDKENAYFADGVQDEILTRLSKIADLKVISRTSTQRYKSSPENLPEIARQLGVANILEGSVQKSGDTVRVNVQLINATNDSHTWADIFDRKLTDILSVESDVARTIAEKLRAKLTGREEEVIADKPTDNPAAYDAYLRGLAYHLKAQNSPGNSLGAQKYLKEAVRLDPKFALSWALLSYVDARGYIGVTLQPTDALREEARQAAETALRLQPNLAEGLLAKGFFYYAYLKDYDTAIHYFEQARQVLPNSSRIPESLAYVARRRGHWEPSEHYFNEAEQLDPRNVSLLSQRAISYIILRRFPEAKRKLDQILNITPDDVTTLALKASVAQAEGDLPGAAAILAPLHPQADDTPAVETQAYQAILERRPDQMIARLTNILTHPDPALGYYIGEMRFWLGWMQEIARDHAAAQENWRKARSELEPFLKDQPDNYNLMQDLALVETGLGNKAAALSLVERAMAVNPIDKDVLDGPVPIEILARVAAQTGEPDRAIAALQKLLSTPYEGALPSGNAPLTPALLTLDPMFDQLRNDPRFQKLANARVPKESAEKPKR